MLCTAPLIDSNGCIFGVCGFEISAMLFKLSHSPGSSIYKRLFCLLSPLAADTIELRRSLIAGGYSARIASSKQNALQISKQRHYLYTYRPEQGHKFLGLHSYIQLYPHDSAFADQHWIVAAMVPEEDITHANPADVILFFATLLVIIGVILSLIWATGFLSSPYPKGSI